MGGMRARTRPGAGRRAGPPPARVPRTTWRRPRRHPAVLASDDAATYVVAPPAQLTPPPGDAAPTPPKRDTTAAQPNVQRLAVLLDEVRAVLDEPSTDVDATDTDALRARIDLLHQLETLTSAALASTVGALRRAGGVTEDGASSTTAWIAQATGRTRREASTLARLATSAPDLPETLAALSRGDIGVSTAASIERAARDGRLGTPAEVEATLLPLAPDGPERLRAHVRRLTQQVDGAEMLRDEQRQRQRRRVSLAQRDDGMWGINGLLTAEVGNRFWTLLNAVTERDPAGTPEGQRRSHEQRLADALDIVTGMALDLGDLPASDGVARPHVSVLIDLTTFGVDLTDPDDPDRPVSPDAPNWSTLPGVETEMAGTMSPQTARKICCDAGISRIVTAGPSQLLDVGRETREWSASQRRAINARDRCCRGPGCGRPIGWTQIHHLRWWRRGGPTAVDNGLALCSACHDLIHHGGWHARLDVATAAVTWTSPDRRRTVVTHPRPPA